MAAVHTPIAFSPGGEYLAYCSPDGRLRIWESATGTLKQEYTPSSHLSATCCCISWCPVRYNSGSARKKKKRKTSLSETIGSLDLVAMGTLSGSILLYSVAKGDLQSEMTDGHANRVNGLCWNTDTDSMYSCSDDGYIVEWSVQMGTVKRKWRGEKGSSISSLCISPDGTALVSASRTIVWWDLESQTIIQKFTGHATEVQQILFISYPDTPVEGSYIVTSAVGDRLISAWQLTRRSRDKNALASFSLPEHPIHLNVLQPASSDQTMLMAAVTKSGSVHVFEHQLNGPVRKPLTPTVTVTVASSTVGNHETPKPIPIVATHLSQDISRNLILAYGNFLRLCLEQLAYSNAEREVCLARADPSRFSTRTEGTSNKIKTPQTSGGVKHLVPVHMDSTGPSESSSKRKRKRSAHNELPMEERLSELVIQTSGADPPRISNLAQLLLQGLQSKDSKILSNVLNRHEDEIVSNTVSRLPVQTVVPLIQQLQNRIHSNKMANNTYLKWIRCILTVHASYLKTCPDVDALLGPLYQLFDAKCLLFEKMSKLRGRMELMWSQICSKTTERQLPTVALLEYQDDSSDAEEMIDDVLPSHSESEDNWNALSDDDEEDDDDKDNIEVEEEIGDGDKEDSAGSSEEMEEDDKSSKSDSEVDGNEKHEHSDSDDNSDF